MSEKASKLRNQHKQAKNKQAINQRRRPASMQKETPTRKHAGKQVVTKGLLRGKNTANYDRQAAELDRHSILVWGFLS